MKSHRIFISYPLIIIFVLCVLFSVVVVVVFGLENIKNWTIIFRRGFLVLCALVVFQFEIKKKKFDIYFLFVLYDPKFLVFQVTRKHTHCLMNFLLLTRKQKIITCNTDNATRNLMHLWHVLIFPSSQS